MDPARADDPADVISGIILASIIPGLLLWLLVHFFTFRVSVADNVMTVSSLVSRRKQVPALAVTCRSRYGGTALAWKGMTFLRKVPCDVLLPSRPGGNWNDVRFRAVREIW